MCVGVPQNMCGNHRATHESPFSLFTMRVLRIKLMSGLVKHHYLLSNLFSIYRAGGTGSHPATHADLEFTL